MVGNAVINDIEKTFVTVRDRFSLHMANNTQIEQRLVLDEASDGARRNDQLRGLFMGSVRKTPGSVEPNMVKEA